MTERGEIKWFSPSKGFGFITLSGSKDIFVHVSGLVDAFIPQDGEKVEFEVRQGKKGQEAYNVQPVVKSAGGNLPKVNIAPPKHDPPASTPIINSPPSVGRGVFLPKKTREAIGDGTSDNFSLELHRMAFYDGKKFVLYQEKDKKNLEEVDVSKRINSDLYCEILKTLKERQKEAVSKEAKSFTYKPGWLTVAGLGGASIFEVCITLHHIYGFPYLPGQALKGVTRNHIINEIFNGIEGGKTEGALSDPLFCAIFGAPSKSCFGKAYKGAVVFLDAYPKSFPSLEVDIMTPHYGDYYQDTTGNKPPADYYQPVPLPFLTVGNKFSFNVLIDAERLELPPNRYHGKLLLETSKLAEVSSKWCSPLSFLDVAHFWLAKALQESGIGAKTAVGYGYAAA